MMLEAPLFCEAKKLSEGQPFMAGRRSLTSKTEIPEPFLSDHAKSIPTNNINPINKITF